jgi:hypothetical protein
VRATLQLLGIQNKLVALCREITFDSISNIDVAGKTCAPFAITSGDREGDALELT